MVWSDWPLLDANRDRICNVNLADGSTTLRVGAVGQLGYGSAFGSDGTMSYMSFPREHWIRIRTNNPLERIMREIRRRTRVVGAFPDGKSALMLVAAPLRHIAGTRWGQRRYLDMDRFQDLETENLAEKISVGLRLEVPTETIS